MLIVLFIGALASGGLTVWLLWSSGVVVALLSACIVASVFVAGLAILLVAKRRRAAATAIPHAAGRSEILSPPNQR